MKKIMAGIAALALSVGLLFVGSVPANAASGGTVCGASPYAVQVQLVNGVNSFIYNYECRSGIRWIGPTGAGRCLQVWGGTSYTWCNSTRLYVQDNRTYWVRTLFN